VNQAPSVLIVGPRRRGRPPRAGVRATERLEFVATSQERADLRRVASAEGKALATIIREAVNEYVADFSERVVFPSGKK
jgi:hypothetical protein